MNTPLLRRARCLALALLTLASLASPRIARAQAQRVRQQVDQRGNFVLIGNSLSYDCRAAVPTPVVGTVGACGTNTADTAGDVFWRSDSPATGQAEANTGITVANARSTAVLSIPAGAVITYARVYWASEAATAAGGPTALFERPGASGFTTTLTADQTYSNNFNALGATARHYESTADVTALVTAHGPGAYRLGNIVSINPVNLNDNTYLAAWSMVVFYQLASDPPRQLTLFDGFEGIQTGMTSNSSISGFLVPAAGFDGRLGVIAYEGDDSIPGDSLAFGGTNLTDALNPATNFFNGTRSFFGAPVTVAGDLPQTTGGAGSFVGEDLDVLDVTARLAPAQTSSTVVASSSGDFFVLGGFVTAISTLKPLFTDTVKTFSDLSSSAGIQPGDVIQYSITTHNTGTDTGVNVVLTDVLPAQLTYLPGSIQITTGANAGAKTDIPADDQADYNALTRTITVRLGTGANAITGGTITTSDPVTTVVFKATVNAGASGTIANQAVISAAGQQGSMQGIGPETFPSNDGSGPNTPTKFDINACVTDADCHGTDPRCNTAVTPHVCVPCTSDTNCASRPGTPACEPSGACGQCSATNRSQCTGTTPVCNVVAGVCGPCTSNMQCGGATPLCGASGACVQCTSNMQCSGATPVCDTTAGVCRGCTSDTQCGGSTPACEPTGRCGQCSASNRSQCTGTTPVCNTAMGVCAPCSSDSQCGGSTPACESNGACGQCSATNTSACTSAAPVCDTVTDRCIARPTVTITMPASGSTTANNRPVISGTATPGTTVTLSIDGGAPVMVTVDASGNWSFTPASPLADGMHTVVATATDRSGNTATASDTFSVNDRPPVVTIVSPPNGSSTNDSRPTIIGSADPNATVTVSIDGGAAITVMTDGTGRWSVVAPTSLADGTHAVTASETNAQGLTGNATDTFTVDTAAPMLAITAPDRGTSTNNPRPAITGTTDPNATVMVSIDGGAPVSVMADATGHWSLTPTSTLADGPHSVTATTTDAAGNTASANTTFTVDTTAPTVSITRPADGSSVATTQPTITGTADPGATVSVSIDGGAPVTVTADASGNWSLVPASPLGAGPHTVTATTQDAAGNSASDSAAFTVDTGAPPLSIDTPANGSTTNDSTPDISGTTTPGAMVTVSVDGGAPVTVTADPTGHWTYTPSTPLGDGPHTVHATSTQPGGGTSTADDTFNVDTTAPSVTITTPSNGSTVSTAQPTVTGTTEPGATVTVTFNGGDSVTVTADASGNYTVVPPAPLADGMVVIVATATDAAGNSATATSTVTVAATAPSLNITRPVDGSSVQSTQPTITGTADPGATVSVSIDGGTPVTVTADASGNWSYTPSAPLTSGSHTATATTTNSAGNTATDSTTFTVDPSAPAISIDAPANGSVTNNPTPAITGTTNPNASVQVSVDGTVIGTVMADASGHYTITPTTPLGDGSHHAQATVQGSGGNSTSAESTFTVDTTAPTITIDQPADTASTNDTTPTITGTTEPGATVSVTVDGMTYVVTADGSGRWTVTVTNPLSEGMHTVMATATDTAGNSATATSTFTVDTTAPTLTITAPTSGSTTGNMPEITGTADPGATVIVTIDGGTTVTVTADASGNWTYTPSTPLANGPHSVTATTTDAAGNTATASTGFVVVPPGNCATNANCSGTTPICDTTAHDCRACASNAECPSTTPACATSGACVMCTATDTTACTGNTPVCSPSNTCVECTAADHARCVGDGAGATCLAGNVCGCNADTDCASGRRCNLTMHRCENRPDGGTDAGRDASVDVVDVIEAGRDASRDVATDTGIDAGSDGAPVSTLTGNGACACRTAGAGSHSGRAGTLALLALGAAVVATRRRRRS